MHSLDCTATTPVGRAACTHVLDCMARGKGGAVDLGRANSTALHYTSDHEPRATGLQASTIVGGLDIQPHRTDAPTEIAVMCASKTAAPPWPYCSIGRGGELEQRTGTPMDQNPSFISPPTRCTAFTHMTVRHACAAELHGVPDELNAGSASNDPPHLFLCCWHLLCLPCGRAPTHQSAQGQGELACGSLDLGGEEAARRSALLQYT